MNNKKQNWLERPIHPALPNVTNEIAIFVAILLLAIVTRFYMLETRVMSHDESLHTYYSWRLSQGMGYEHSPMMHGPLQFHMVGLTYFLFGANDFTSRIPAALFSIATVFMVWYWRRYLGKWGSLIAGFLLVISPYMLYYGRYVRNESFVGLSGLLMLYAMLRHLEVGGKKYLLLLTGALCLHFLVKETSFIYTAEALIYLAVYFIAQVTRRPWKGAEKEYRAFIISLGIAVLLIGATAGYMLFTRDAASITGTETAAPSNPDAAASALTEPLPASTTPMIVFALASLIALVVAAIFLIEGYTWEKIRKDRAFDLLMVSGTIVLPMLSPFLIKATEPWTQVPIPAEANQVQAMLADPKSILTIGGFLILTFIVSVVIGLIWNKEFWWKTALLFWVPYTIFYTTIFTNANGFFTGTIGSLGYWIVQQDVQRGSQPWYYYVLVQIPVYEFLPALGLILALFVGLRRRAISKIAEDVVDENDEVILLPEAEVLEVSEEVSETAEQDIAVSEEKNFSNTFSLLFYWSIISVAAFTFAGERMPWLTYHMAYPMILITGWALGRIIDTTDWAKLREQRVPLGIATLAVFVASLGGAMYAYNGPIPPFQGKDLSQLQATNAFLLPMVVAILSGGAMFYFFKSWTFKEMRRVFTLVVFAFLAVLTARAAFRASYITYDQATEYLVYAHGATGIKDIIKQATEISQRTTGGMNVAIAYDTNGDTGVSWPFVWYLRDFTNQSSFDQPTRSLRDKTLIIVGQVSFDKIEPALGNGFNKIDYVRMWWPNQDYFFLTSDRDASQPFPPEYACNGVFSVFKLFKSKDFSQFCEGFTNPAIRNGLLQIWLNRDYTAYAQAKGRSDLTVATWEPSSKMRLYIRKDVAEQMWNYGVAPVASETIVDPTEGKYVTLSADLVLNVTQPGQLPLSSPRTFAFAKDGTVYISDSGNNRILHLDMQGNVINSWGAFADGASIPVGPGTFNESWGIAIGPDGSVYATDTWNHRVEKFTSTGKFIKAWGIFGQAETPDAFYGPRGLAVDSEGRVYVMDTGNKRVVVFDANGVFVTQFGSGGFDPGQFDEPTSVAVDKNGTVYVADTWNQRVQTFVPIEDENGLSFIPDKQWDVYGWFGQSLENKPYIAVNDAGHVFITDPDGYRVMEFDSDGKLLRVWGDFGDSISSFGLPSGITVDQEGGVWVSDSLNNRLMRFTMP